jgi:glucan biosynthesis protein
VLRNPQNGAWRLTILLEASPGGPVADIRAQLTLDQKPVTEWWTTRWQP